MAAALITLTNALVTLLSATPWSGGSFTVASTYADADELLEATEGEDATVDVIVPDNYDRIELDTKGSTARTVTVEVVVRRKFGVDDQDGSTGSIDDAAVNDLVELVETIALMGTYDRLADYAAAAWLASDHDPLFDRTRLRKNFQFFSVTLLTFEIHSAL
jgi:hypothetical protein